MLLEGDVVSSSYVHYHGGFVILVPSSGAGLQVL